MTRRGGGAHGAILAGVTRYPALDGLRGVAILWLMGYHLWYYDGANPIGRALSAVFGVGWAGVDLFFAISGFLITGILVDSKSEPGGLKRFFIRRALRIVPAYYTVVTILLLGGLAARFSGSTPSDGDLCSPSKVWIHYLFLSNFALALRGQEWTCFDIAWSVAVEEQFYLVLPWVVLLLSRLGLRRVVLGAAIAAPVLRLFVFWASGNQLLPPYALPFCRMDALALGGLVALALRDGFAAASFLGRHIGLLLMAAGLALSVGVRAESWFVFAGYSAIAAASASIVARVVARPRDGLSTFLQSGWLMNIGRMSYGLYLWHLLARAAVDHATSQVWFHDAGNDVSTAALRVLLATLASLALAKASWRLIESPFLRLKDRLAGPPKGLVE